MRERMRELLLLLLEEIDRESDFPLRKERPAEENRAKLETIRKRVLQAIRDSGSDGISRNALSRRCSSSGSATLGMILEDLDGAGVIMSERSRPGESGRPSTVYFAKTLDPQIGSR